MPVENIKAMLAEIEKMQAFVLQPENYDRGYDTMAECWDDSDYERLFYKINTSADAGITKLQPEVRCTFAEAWQCLHDIASAFHDRQADADFHASGEWPTTPIQHTEPEPTPTTTTTTTATTRIPSRNAADTPDGAATAVLKPNPQYTGTAVLGIATMHKSNLVPIFNPEAAVDAATMRRN